MGKMVIGSLTFEEVTDAQLDATRRQINELLKRTPEGSWLLLKGEAGTNVVWISPSTPMRLDYDGEPPADEMSDVVDYPAPE